MRYGRYYGSQEEDPAVIRAEGLSDISDFFCMASAQCGYLKRLLSKALELSISKELDEGIPELLKSFERVCLIDSTAITLPESLCEIWRGSGGDGLSSAMKL